MFDFFRSELVRFRAWAVLAAVVHVLALAFMARVVDLGQQPLLVHRVIGGVYALCGLLLGLYQMGSYRKPSQWVSLLHRPMPPGADVVYAKSWGALPFFGNWEPEKPIRDQYKHFIVDERKMALTNNGVFSHCLPLRRNVKATDGVMDSPQCIAIDEAENRLHVQKAIMAALMQQ